MNTTTPQIEIIKRTLTGDRVGVLVLSSGDVTDQNGRTWTMHRALDVSTALLVAGEACLFNAAEMPALIAAAHKLARKSSSGVLPGDLRALASRLSHKAGTRPADVAPPGEKPRTALLAAWTPQELALRAAGYIVAPSARKVTI